MGWRSYTEMAAKKKKRSRTGVKKKASKTALEPEWLEPQAFLDRLEAAGRAIGDRRNTAPTAAVAWVQTDDRPAHLERLGFRGLLRLEKAVGERILANLGPGDVGTKFPGPAIGVLLELESGQRDIGQWAADTVRAVSGELFEWDDQAVAATVSIGLCVVDSNVSEGADQALREAAGLAEALTASGGNRAKIWQLPRSHDDDRARLILRHLVEALKSNALRVVYQPIMAVGDSEKSRYQLLPRLAGPDGRLIAAAEFVPQAAVRGVLPVLDRWMLGRAVQILRGQSADTSIMCIFLAQSSALIDDPKFLAWLVKQLKAKPELARRLVLEFSIADIQARLKPALGVLTTLKGHGLEICIGGVDENSPEELLLEHVPADYLRMAPAFTKQLLAKEAVSRRYRQFAIRARAAGRSIIIPMLEDAESVARVWQMDVDLIQGNFIQEPREQPGD